jgi:hypothetical protein
MQISLKEEKYYLNNRFVQRIIQVTHIVHVWIGGDNFD